MAEGYATSLSLVDFIDQKLTQEGGGGGARVGGAPIRGGEERGRGGIRDAGRAEEETGRSGGRVGDTQLGKLQKCAIETGIPTILGPSGRSCRNAREFEMRRSEGSGRGPGQGGDAWAGGGGESTVRAQHSIRRLPCPLGRVIGAERRGESPPPMMMMMWRRRRL